MIYLISQITFLFLTQIYYNMNFITSSSILPQDFPGTLRLIFADCFWRTFLWYTKNEHLWIYLQNLSERIRNFVKMQGNLWPIIVLVGLVYPIVVVVHLLAVLVCPLVVLVFVLAVIVFPPIILIFPW